jgi:signal transduction histidine kinase
MTEETVKHICDEFYMADKSRSRKEGGAGLGMSLALLILERHGAVLDIDSTPGAGTTMRVTFKENRL